MLILEPGDGLGDVGLAAGDLQFLGLQRDRTIREILLINFKFMLGVGEFTQAIGGGGDLVFAGELLGLDLVAGFVEPGAMLADLRRELILVALQPRRRRVANF